VGEVVKITAFCPTLNRPELLGHLIKCFENQTYENRELVILDDSGQYDNQSGDRWQLISVPRRFRSLGEKNNAVMAMASQDTDAYAKADDDDIYMPWWLESVAEALHNGEIVQPRVAIDFVNGEWVRTETFNRKRRDHFAYHGCWGFRRSLVEKTGGYRPEYAGDDQELQRRLLSLRVNSVGIHSRFKPFYWYNRPLANRISERGGSREAYLNTKVGHFVGKVPEWCGEKCWERPIPEKLIQRPW
jgi:glycosyltransferase involved in cell wall biosynthesis